MRQLRRPAHQFSRRSDRHQLAIYTPTGTTPESASLSPLTTAKSIANDLITTAAFTALSLAWRPWPVGGWLGERWTCPFTKACSWKSPLPRPCRCCRNSRPGSPGASRHGAAFTSAACYRRHRRPEGRGSARSQRRLNRKRRATPERHCLSRRQEDGLRQLGERTATEPATCRAPAAAGALRLIIVTHELNERAVFRVLARSLKPSLRNYREHVRVRVAFPCALLPYSRIRIFGNKSEARNRITVHAKGRRPAEKWSHVRSKSCRGPRDVKYQDGASRFSRQHHRTRFRNISSVPAARRS